MDAARLAGLIGALFGALAVVLGAFGAHALRAQTDATTLPTWHTAVEYQFWHALVLLVVAARLRAGSSRVLLGSVAGLICGTVLFCGSLYALALGAPHWLGLATPVGGGFLTVAWGLLGADFWRGAKKNPD